MRSAVRYAARSSRREARTAALSSSRIPVAAAPSGSRSCSQRTIGIRRARAFAIAGARAGKLGEPTSIRSGRGISGRPRNGAAAVREAVSSSELLAQPRRPGVAAGQEGQPGDLDSVDPLPRGKQPHPQTGSGIVRVGRDHIDLPPARPELPGQESGRRGDAGQFRVEVDGPELQAASRAVFARTAHRGPA